MAIFKAITLFLLLLPLASSTKQTLDWWCNRTPYPRTCRHYLSPYTDHPPQHRSDFTTLSVQIAYTLTLHAQSRLQSLSTRASTRKSRKAILDCSKLYGNTLIQLNRTLNPHPPNCTRTDKQTWLSAALTNLRTCKKGFSDLKASTKLVVPVYRRYNISELISNCLAVNRPRNMTVLPPAGRAPGRTLLQLQATAVGTNFVVAKGGSGKYRTVQAAVNAATYLRRNGYVKRIAIYVKAGVYNEIVTVSSSLTDLIMIGDGMGKTVITGSRSVARGYTTFSSPTFSVFGDRFVGTGITFRNTYGPGSQAVALLSGSDQSVFYKCSIEGYQDTLCVYTQRQFYRECNIFGTIDFIFGNAAAVIQKCTLYIRKPNHGESNVITAQGRTDPNQNTGIVIQFSRIRATSELWAVRKTVRSYLGRPWMLYSRTVYMQNTIDGIIHPSGWLPFKGEFALNTLYYAEFKNIGSGSIMRFRVKWRGYHIIVRPSFVTRFTVANFIAGAAWLPGTKVPYSLGL